jgi:RNA polymerase sigma-32 factor
MANSRIASIVADKGLSGYLRRIGDFPMLTHEEERTLAARWRDHQDPEAAHKLVTSHLRLVIKIAMGYRGYGLPLAELIAEGSVGMMQAVVRFDPERGFRLTSYAIWWIKASIQDYILQSWSLVRVATTVSQKKLFFNLRKLKRQLQAIDDGDLSPEHVEKIATELSVSEHDVVDMNRRLAGPDHSLNTPLKAESESEWQDWLVDEQDDQEIRLGNEQELDMRRMILRKAMTQFAERERNILMERRLKDTPATLGELSEKYGISRERVRQIEVHTFRKLQKVMISAAPERHIAVG